MRLPHVEDPRGLDVAIVGVPYDGGTSYRPGARLGPREIRSQSSIRTTQPTPIIVPKPNVKYSIVLRLPWSAGCVESRAEAIRCCTIPGTDAAGCSELTL